MHSRLFLKLILFLICLTLLQLTYTHFVPKVISQPTLDKLSRTKPAPRTIYFFGDSTVNYTSPQDTNPSTLPQLLDQYLPDYHVLDLAHPAQTPILYLTYTQFLLSQGLQPDLVIFPINARSFSPQWDLKPNYQFPTVRFLAHFHNHLLAKAVVNPATTLHFLDANRGLDQYLATPIYRHQQLLGNISTIRDESTYQTQDDYTKTMMTYFYLCSLTPDHRQLQALIHTAQLLEKNHVPTLFYLTPIDIQSGTHYTGPNFASEVTANTATIKSSLEGFDYIHFLDLSAILDPTHFAWDKIPNEHLRDSGRQAVISSLLSSSPLNSLE